MEKRMSIKRLTDMKLIRKANDHVLPTKSHFGTINSSSICTEKDAKRCVKKFKNLETRLRVASKYRLMACLIQKNMSTLLQAIMCFLHDEEAFKKAGRVFSRESTDVRYCRDKNEYNYVRIVEKAFSITKNTTASWKYLAVVRDPVDRFLSAYVDKCIRKPYAPKYCNDCGANMTCFVMREYDRIMKQASIKWMARTFEDRHFFPQSWRCNFDERKSRYSFIRYSSDPKKSDYFMEQLVALVQPQGVRDASLKFIEDQMKAGRTIHSTFHSDARNFYEKRLRSSPYLMEFVVRMFYWDFVMFDYEIPSLKFVQNGLNV